MATRWTEMDAAEIAGQWRTGMRAWRTNHARHQRATLSHHHHRLLLPPPPYFYFYSYSSSL